MASHSHISCFKGNLCSVNLFHEWSHLRLYFSPSSSKLWKGVVVSFSCCLCGCKSITVGDWHRQRAGQDELKEALCDGMCSIRTELWVWKEQFLLIRYWMSWVIPRKMFHQDCSHCFCMSLICEFSSQNLDTECAFSKKGPHITKCSILLSLSLGYTFQAALVSVRFKWHMP